MLDVIYSIVLSVMVYLTPNDKLDAGIVYQYCVHQNIKFPEIVTAQAIVETGWFKCKDCTLEDNNLFGFNSGGNYIKFSSWRKSVNYYKEWQTKYYKDQKNYYNFLSCIRTGGNGDCMKYATDMNEYEKLLTSIIKNHLHEWKNSHKWLRNLG